MNTLRCVLDEYLLVRRSLGFKLERDGLLLAQFVSFCEQAGIDTITVAAAWEWTNLPANPGVSWLTMRLSVVRSFARYVQAINPATEVPPTRLLPARGRTIVPFLYTDTEIAALMAAARALRSPSGAPMYENLIGLLAVTGLRVGEALNLDRGDVRFDEAIVVVRAAKAGKSRLVPIHPTTVNSLRSYTETRDRLLPGVDTASFFVTANGTRPTYSSIQHGYKTLTGRAELKPRSELCRPRIHDLRHTFATRTLLDWYRAGLNIEARLAVLSTWLGHVDPKSTYWYLSATPELLSIAAGRLNVGQVSEP